MDSVTRELRVHQESHPVFGTIYKSLHTFADRTIDRFYEETFPSPVISMEKDRRTRLGVYKVEDGYKMANAINLNPDGHKDGLELVETLAHEIVHLWQRAVGRPCKRNYHGAEFHERMLRYGITTSGPKGMHKSHSSLWLNWLDQNDDLYLDKFQLPGAEDRQRRQLIKHECPNCGNPVRSRKFLSLKCLDCGSNYQRVLTSEQRARLAKLTNKEVSG